MRTDAGGAADGGGDAATDGAVALVRDRRLPAARADLPDVPRAGQAGRRHAAPVHRHRRDRLRDRADVRRHLRARGEPPAVQDERQRPRGRDGLRRRIARVPDRLALDPARSTTMKPLTVDRDPILLAPSLLGWRARAAPSSRATSPTDRRRPRAHHRRDRTRRRRRSDHHDHRHHQRRHRRRATPSPAPTPPSPPSTARASSPASRPARRRDRHGRRHDGDRQLPVFVVEAEQPPRSPTTDAWTMSAHADAHRRSPSTTGTRTGSVPADMRPLPQLARGSSTTSAATAARRAWSTSRRRRIGRSAADLPQPGRRRADLGDLSLGRRPSTAWAARRAA